jgi:hypothetical protein
LLTQKKNHLWGTLKSPGKLSEKNEQVCVPNPTQKEQTDLPSNLRILFSSPRHLSNFEWRTFHFSRVAIAFYVPLKSRRLFSMLFRVCPHLKWHNCAISSFSTLTIVSVAPTSVLENQPEYSENTHF